MFLKCMRCDILHWNMRNLLVVFFLIPVLCSSIVKQGAWTSIVRMPSQNNCVVQIIFVGIV